VSDSSDKSANDQVQQIDWEQIDDVFLDMDGTLLDLHFDNHFWLQYLPEHYATLHDITFDAAREKLLVMYAVHVGTLKWYCIDHWSAELGVDILSLKEEVEHLIQLHPHVDEFLHMLQSMDTRVTLLTNAHPKTLAFKLQRIPLAHRFDHLITSHEVGLPKENPAFWEKLQQRHRFDVQRTLFVDDSLPVLHSADDYGIHKVIAITAPDSTQQHKEVEGFLSIRDFSELM
jgi:HAD superfamily hydrolase (TIGR01509 family)